MVNSTQNNNDWGTTDDSPQFIPSYKSLDVTKENKLIYIIGITALSISVLGTIGGIITLAWYAKEIPQALIAIGSVAVTALGALFTQHR